MQMSFREFNSARELMDRTPKACNAGVTILQTLVYKHEGRGVAILRVGLTLNDDQNKLQYVSWISGTSDHRIACTPWHGTWSVKTRAARVMEAELAFRYTVPTPVLICITVRRNDMHHPWFATEDGRIRVIDFHTLAKVFDAMAPPPLPPCAVPPPPPPPPPQERREQQQQQQQQQQQHAQDSSDANVQSDALIATSFYNNFAYLYPEFYPGLR